MSDAQKLKTSANTRYKGEVVRLGCEAGRITKVSTGLLALDETTNGGLPLGMPILLSGKKSTGKSAFCYYMAGRIAESGWGVPVLIQTELGFDIDWAIQCGFRAEASVFVEGEALVLSLETLLDLIRKEQPGCIILDSLSALPVDPDKSLLDNVSLGERAKPINEFFRKLGPVIDDEHPPLILIVEHLHPNLTSKWGGYITTGGETKGYIACLELRFTTVKLIREEFEAEGGKIELPVEQTIQWEVKKSKVSPMGGVGFFNLGLREAPFCSPGELSDYEDLLQRAIHLKAIKKSGAWYSYGELKAQGLPGIKAALGPCALREIITEARERARAGLGEQNKGQEEGGVGQSQRAEGRPKKRGRAGKRGMADRKQDDDALQSESEAGLASEDKEGSGPDGEDAGSGDNDRE